MDGTLVGSTRWRVRVLAVALVSMLILAGCSTGNPPDGATTTAPSATTVDTGLPEEPGPYGVSHATVTLTDPARDGRTLTTEIWFPVDPDDAAAAVPAPPYILVPGPGDEATRSIGDVPVSTNGPFPFVVFSHGSDGMRWLSAFFTELLASHGFVVASADHVGNTTVENLLGTSVPVGESAVDRPRDATFVIDALLAGANGAPPDLVAAIDPGRIGIGGHSFGGYTSLAMASGRPGIPADRRIKAVLGLAAWTTLLSDAELEAVDVPTMLMSGTLDTLIPIPENTERPWTLIPGRPLYRVDITDAGHHSFTGVCDVPTLARSLPGLPAQSLAIVENLAQQSCDPQFLDLGTAHQIVNRYGVAFFQAHVAGDASAMTLLTPEAAQQTPAVTFQVKE